MLGMVKKLIQKGALDRTEEQDEDSSYRIQVATCALLLEVANSDDEFSESEREHIVRILTKDFQLSHEDAQELMQLSERERKESIDLWQFTNQINEHYSLDEKIKIIEMVWKVIYADGKLNQYEDHLVHKLSRLLRLTHDQLIEAKLKVKYGAQNE